MKGLWKENLGGWNAKDTKRKKQARNHTLKDNGYYVVTAFDGYRDSNKKVNDKVFRHETETELVKKGTYDSDKPIVTKADVINVWITWNKIDDEGNFIADYKVKSTLFYSNTTYWKEYYKTESRNVNVYANKNRNDNLVYLEGTNELVYEDLGLTKKQVRNMEFGAGRKTQRVVLLPDYLIKEAIERKNKIIVQDHDQDKAFIYGKPLESWKRMTFFDDGGRRKYAQNRANRMDRRNIKAWIKGKDISKPLKTHALSKSIAWDIW